MFFKIFLFLIAFSLLAQPSHAAVGSGQPNHQKLVDQYLDLAGSLVKSDLKKSKAQAAKLVGLLSATPSKELQTHGTSVALSNSLPEMRTAFARLSTALKDYLSTVTDLEEPIYVAHCPMALNDTGAIWLTDEKKVVNPYFGMEMLHCGKILGTVTTAKP